MCVSNACYARITYAPSVYRTHVTHVSHTRHARIENMLRTYYTRAMRVSNTCYARITHAPCAYRTRTCCARITHVSCAYRTRMLCTKEEELSLLPRLRELLSCTLAMMRYAAWRAPARAASPSCGGGGGTVGDATSFHPCTFHRAAAPTAGPESASGTEVGERNKDGGEGTHGGAGELRRRCGGGTVGDATSRNHSSSSSRLRAVGSCLRTIGDSLAASTPFGDAASRNHAFARWDRSCSRTMGSRLRATLTGKCSHPGVRHSNEIRGRPRTLHTLDTHHRALR